MLKINGELVDVAGVSVARYLSDNGYNITRVAVEINGDILPKSQYEVRLFEDEDKVEIVGFVGGG